MRTSPDFIFQLLLLSLEPYSATPPGVCEEGHLLRGRVSFSGTCGCHTAQQPTVLKRPLTLAGCASAPLRKRVGSHGTLFLGVSTVTF